MSVLMSPNENRRRLDVRIREDFLVAVSVIFLAIGFLGFFLIAFLLWEIIEPILRRRRLPRELSRHIRAFHGLPRLLVLRASDGPDCYVVSGLGIATMMISKDVIEEPESELSRLKIQHEVGHLRRADRILASGLSSAAFLALLVVAYGLALHILGNLIFPDLGAAYLLISGYALLFVIGIGRTADLAHTREYLADSHAMATEGAVFEAYLRKRAQRERYTKQRYRILRWANALSHPTFAQRLQMQTEATVVSGWSGFSRAALTGMVVTLAVMMSFTDQKQALNIQDWAGFGGEFLRRYLEVSASLSPVLGFALVAIVAIRLPDLFTRACALDRGALLIAGYVVGAVFAIAVALLGLVLSG